MLLENTKFYHFVCFNKYEYKYIWIDTNLLQLKKWHIPIQIYLGVQKKANKNTNRNIQTGNHKCAYKYEYSSHTGS